MDNFLGWLRDVFKNDDIVSALTGETVEPPISDPKRKRNTQISTAVGYVTLFAVIVFLSTILPEPPKLARNPDLPNLIFVMTEGPGGGGGGGGELTEDPASVQKIEGQDQAKIAIEIESPEDKLIFEDPDRPPEVEEEKEVVEEDEVPEIVAPVVAQAPDDTTAKGILEGQEQLVESAGAGSGSGIGQGQGSGLGEGTGGGFGGGVYRMGSGLTAPVLVRQIQPGFTEEALARKIQGEVVVEVVILKNGTVRVVRVLRGLSADLNQKAIDAASQWRFIPAKFKGQPVDLIAEIVVDFNIL
ncbi:MAG TPA: energy transducer TonB [Vicinamibacteria bacterium]|nr:energy transducer TonB [Vicinamibacteria bacterium]